MATRSNLETEVAQLAEPICAAVGVELVLVNKEQRPQGVVFQVTIDRDRPASDPRPGSGITLGDCQAVSRDLNTALEMHTEVFAEVNFFLEVSSPGLERPLVRLSDFDKYRGREAKIKTYAAIKGHKHITGILLGTDGNLVKIEMGERTIEVPHESIAKANLVYRS